MIAFDETEATRQCVLWIRDFFEKNGPGCNAIVGISGGKDSSVTAALCVEALGKDRVVGVLMPCGEQKDIDMAKKLVNHLEIRSIEVNIETAVKGILDAITDGMEQNAQQMKEIRISEQTKVNLPARIRMSALYAVSQSMNGRVANTCNLSEDWVGYSTRYGDAAGDFSPLANFTVTEVKAIGSTLGLPKELIEKIPADGLSGKTDEENLGFTYEVLDRYIREGVCKEDGVKKRIDQLHQKNLFKLEQMPAFEWR